MVARATPLIPRRPIRLCLAFLLAAGWSTAPALEITNYNSVTNDRFSGGFATNPVSNTNPGFVGQGYDWSGAAWSTTDYGANGFKGFGMLSPRHFLAAQHYEYGAEATLGVRVLGFDEIVHAAPVQSLTNLGQGIVLANQGFTNHDLAVGVLSNMVTSPSNMARLAVLDLNATANVTTLSNYVNLPLFAYGRGPSTDSSPRVGSAIVSQAVLAQSDPDQAVLVTTWADVRFQVGDSGSPAFHSWTNPDGARELALVGLNSAVDGVNQRNIISLLSTPAALAAANAAMNPDGFALRVAGNPAAAWQGGSGSPAQQTQLNRAPNWSGNAVPSDLYVRFAGDQTSFRDINVNADTTLRGLYFNSTPSSANGFTFSGAGTLTVGRGGIVNYDISRQDFTAALALGDPQYWDGGTGGITVSSVNGNGQLLEITGAGTNRITGNLSGAGGLAVSGGRLEVTASNSYTGATWVHGGRLMVDGRIEASSGVEVGTYGSLGGSGRVAAVSGAGSVDPGNSPGILTAPAVDAADGLDFNFEFTLLGSPDFSDAFASGNDLLRLTAATPFIAALATANTVSVYMSFASLNPGDAFRGGFFADQVDDFLASVTGADFVYYLADVTGDYIYNDIAYRLFDDYDLEVGTVTESADFADGTVTGGIVEFTVVPEPSIAGLLSLAALWSVVAAVRRRLIKNYS